MKIQMQTYFGHNLDIIVRQLTDGRLLKIKFYGCNA